MGRNFSASPLHVYTHASSLGLKVNSGLRGLYFFKTKLKEANFGLKLSTLIHVTE